MRAPLTDQRSSEPAWYTGVPVYPVVAMSNVPYRETVTVPDPNAFGCRMVSGPCSMFTAPVNGPYAVPSPATRATLESPRTYSAPCPHLVKRFEPDNDATENPEITPAVGLAPYETFTAAPPFVNASAFVNESTPDCRNERCLVFVNNTRNCASINVPPVDCTSTSLIDCTRSFAPGSKFKVA